MTGRAPAAGLLLGALGLAPRSSGVATGRLGANGDGRRDILLALDGDGHDEILAAVGHPGLVILVGR